MPNPPRIPDREDSRTYTRHGHSILWQRNADHERMVLRVKQQREAA